MYYVYLEVDSERALLSFAPDLLSAQFFALKYSLTRNGAVAVYPAATGGPRQALAVFENGVRRSESQSGPPAPPPAPVPTAPALTQSTDTGG